MYLIIKRFTFKRFVRLSLTLIACLILTSCTGVSNQNTKKEIPDDQWLYKTVDAPASLNSEDIYTFMCELIIQQPREILNTCADGGIGIWDIKWSTWGYRGAVGDGILRVNDCEPNCAEGTFSSRPVRVELTGFHFDGSKYIYNTAKINYISTTNAEGEPALIWDLADFYRNVPEMRSDN